MDQLITEKFHLKGKTPQKIKHTTLIANYVDGGYKDVDIATKLESLKIIWIRRMLDNNFYAWKAILHTFGIQKLLHKNFKPSQICKSEINLYPKFYQEVISPHWVLPY